MDSKDKLKDILRSLIKEVVSEGDKGNLLNNRASDPKNPDIHVSGVAVYKKDSLEANVIRKFEDLIERAKRGNDWEFIEAMLNPKAILPHMVGALADVQRELKTPVMKRKITLMGKKVPPTV